MKSIHIIYALFILLFTGCEEKVTGLKYQDGYLEIHKEAELRYISEVAQRNAKNPEPLMTIDGIAIPFKEASLRFMDDVEIKDTWIPIKAGYEGSFKEIDGNHHTITFKISSLEVKNAFDEHTSEFYKFGIFDRLGNCEVKNLNLAGEIGLYNSMILGAYNLSIGALAGEIEGNVILNNISSYTAISFREKTGDSWLTLGGIAGMMSCIFGPNEFKTTVKNEGNLQAEGCPGTQIGGISAKLPDNVVLSPNVTLENRGNITANLSNSKSDFVNAIGGVVGWWALQKINSNNGILSGMSNTGNLQIIVNGSPADFYVGGVCGRFGDGNRIINVKGMENSGNIEVCGNGMGQFCYIGGVIGDAGAGQYHKLINNGKIKVSQPEKAYIGGLIGSYNIGYVSTMFSCNRDNIGDFIPFEKTELGPMLRKCSENH